MLIQVEIQGTQPLLMHRFTEESQVSVGSGIRKHTPGRDQDGPREMAEKAAYRDSETEELYLPAENLLAAIIDAGRYFKVKRSALTTARSSMVPAGVHIDGLILPLGTKEFEVDSRSVVNPNTGGRIMAHRPRLDKWGVKFMLIVDEELFDEKIVRELVDAAGKRIGVGAYRPARRGPFGTFAVTSWEVVG